MSGPRPKDPPAGDESDEEVASGAKPREAAFDVGRYAEDVHERELLPTVTNEGATEHARIASVLMGSTPPRAFGLSAPAVELDPAQQISLLRAKLAPMSRVPALVRALAELGPMIEEPRTAYILGFVDGVLPLETIIDVVGLPELDVLRVFVRAFEDQVVTFSTPPEP